MSSYTPPTVVDDPQAPELTKYLRVPMDADEEFEIRESIVRRKQSNFLSRVVGACIVLAVAASLIGGIIFYAEHHQKHHSHSESGVPTAAPTANPLSVCYTDITCPVIGSNDPKYDAATGFTNYTGWFDGVGVEKCCNICSPNLRPPTVAVAGAAAVAEAAAVSRRRHFSSSSYRFNLSDFDYIIFDQLWLPQLCLALAEGHDPTLSHSSHMRCDPAVFANADSFTRLSIHGVWPSNLHGSFLSCCASSAGEHLSTVDPVVMATWSIADDMQRNWFDPTALTDAVVPLLQQSKDRQRRGLRDASVAFSPPTTNVSCGTCVLPNHEYQKHGTCFGTGADADFVYFATGLNISNAVSSASEQINAWAGQYVAVDQFEALFPTAINVLCDAQSSHEGSQVFFELRTCWNLTSSVEAFRVPYALGDAANHWGLTDCLPAGSTAHSTSCDADSLVYMPLLA